MTYVLEHDLAMARYELRGARARGAALELRCDALEAALVRIRDTNVGGVWSASQAAYVDEVFRSLAWMPNRPCLAREKP